MWMALAGLVGGLVILTVGAEVLVRGAGTMAVRAGLRPIIIGLTVVALGTSSPELVVSVTAALKNHPDVSIGNVIGSNLFNILAILGFAAIVRPMSIQSQTIRYEMPIMIGISVAMWVMALDGRISRVDGVVLLALFAGFMGYCYRFARTPELERTPQPLRSMSGAVVLTILGCAGLGYGGQLAANNAVIVAEHLGVSKLVIGLTVIAFGTSLPELAASVIAAVRGHEDLSVGNVVGSNIFNIGLVLGLTAVMFRGGIPVPPDCLRWDIPICVGASILVLPMMWSRRVLARVEGVLLVAGIVAYTFLRYAHEVRMI
ncbi:MAG: calcium/sodium antiporter [Phycisphaerae bacterium]|nr:calcium/sodium antiporter [Phycisphaerae bacterium]